MACLRIGFGRAGTGQARAHRRQVTGWHMRRGKPVDRPPDKRLTRAFKGF